MTRLTVFEVLVLLPAFIHELDSLKARLKNIRDLATLFEEIGRGGERAVITIGLLPAVRRFSANIERFLEMNKDFAFEFGGFSRNTLYLAHLYLGGGECTRLQCEKSPLVHFGIIVPP